MFTVFGSPYSRFKGDWAFGYEPKDADSLWRQIPAGSDIVVTHVPPNPPNSPHEERVAVGCEGLHKALQKVRPILVVCGHVHEGRGYHRIRWEATLSGDRSGNEEVIPGSLPPIGSKKQCLVDLTGKRQRRLDNFSNECHGNSSPGRMFTGQLEDDCSHLGTAAFAPQDGRSNKDGARPTESEEGSERRETCVVNAAIVATSWPHRGGKKFHAPIVVDLELPTWDCHPKTEPNVATAAGR